AGSQSLEEMLTQYKIVTHNEERKALWTAMRKAWPKTFGKPGVTPGVEGASAITIDLYAENDLATEICFSRRNAVYLFNGHEGRIVSVPIAKVLPHINAITFIKSKGPMGYSYILWSYGRPEVSVGSSLIRSEPGSDLNNDTPANER